MLRNGTLTLIAALAGAVVLSGTAGAQEDCPRGTLDKAKIRTIYKSETFPTTSYGIAHNLDPALAAKIKEAFFTFPWEGSALKAEFKTEDRFVPITYQKDWSVIRKIDGASGVKYTCK